MGVRLCNLCANTHNAYANARALLQQIQVNNYENCQKTTWGTRSVKKNWLKAVEYNRGNIQPEQLQNRIQIQIPTHETNNTQTTQPKTNDPEKTPPRAISRRRKREQNKKRKKQIRTL